MSAEDSECAYEEVQADQSSIQPQVAVPSKPKPAELPATPHPDDQNVATKKSSWQYEETKEKPEDPPLFSQLRVHLLLKGIMANKGVDAMKDELFREYNEKCGVRAVNIYIKKHGDGSATAYVGFRYDYEAYRVINSQNKIRIPLYAKNGDKGIPEYEVTELFSYWLDKNGSLLKEQARRYFSRDGRPGEDRLRRRSNSRGRERREDYYGRSYVHRSSGCLSGSHERGGYQAYRHSKSRSPPRSYVRDHLHTHDRDYLADAPKDYYEREGTSHQGRMEHSRNDSRSRSRSRSKERRCRGPERGSRSAERRDVGAGRSRRRDMSRSSSRERKYSDRGGYGAGRDEYEPREHRCSAAVRTPVRYDKEPAYSRTQRASKSRSSERRPREYIPEYRPEPAVDVVHQNLKPRPDRPDEERAQHKGHPYPQSAHSGRQTQPPEEGEIVKEPPRTCYVFGIPTRASDDDIRRELTKCDVPEPKQFVYGTKGMSQIWVLVDDGKGNVCRYTKMEMGQENIERIFKGDFEVNGHPVLVIEASDDGSAFDLLKDYQVKLVVGEKEEVGADVETLQKFLCAYGVLVDLNLNGLKENGTVVGTFAGKDAVGKLIGQRTVLARELQGRQAMRWQVGGRSTSIFTLWMLLCLSRTGTVSTTILIRLLRLKAAGCIVMITNNIMAIDIVTTNPMPHASNIVEIISVGKILSERIMFKDINGCAD